MGRSTRTPPGTTPRPRTPPSTSPATSPSGKASRWSPRPRHEALDGQDRDRDGEQQRDRQGDRVDIRQRRRVRDRRGSTQSFVRENGRTNSETRRGGNGASNRRN